MPKKSRINKPKAIKAGLKIKFILFFLSAVIFTMLILFLPAGSLGYWQAWLFMGALFIPVIFVVLYFSKHDPELLERRVKFKEKEAEQKVIIKIANLTIFIGLLIPGFDYRFGWSNVPTALVIFSDIVIFLGYSLVFFVFKENRYTSRIIEVDKKQKVITTGPYSVVRHPMYAGIIPIYLFIPLALGSYWALIFFIPSVALVIIRTLNEEKVLSRDLKGYKKYMKKVKYRLIPYIW